MKLLLFLAATAGLAITGFAHLKAAGDDLKPGDPAPPFSLVGSDGQNLSPRRFPGQTGGRARVVSQGVHQRLNGRVQVAP